MHQVQLKALQLGVFADFGARLPAVLPQLSSVLLHRLSQLFFLLRRSGDSEEKYDCHYQADLAASVCMLCFHHRFLHQSFVPVSSSWGGATKLTPQFAAPSSIPRLVCCSRCSASDPLLMLHRVRCGFRKRRRERNWRKTDFPAARATLWSRVQLCKPSAKWFGQYPGV